jgi:hypothetical protein
MILVVHVFNKVFQKKKFASIDKDSFKDLLCRRNVFLKIVFYLWHSLIDSHKLLIGQLPELSSSSDAFFCTQYNQYIYSDLVFCLEIKIHTVLLCLHFSTLMTYYLLANTAT